MYGEKSFPTLNPCSLSASSVSSTIVLPLPEDVSKHIECDFSFIRFMKESFSSDSILDPP